MVLTAVSGVVAVFLPVVVVIFDILSARPTDWIGWGKQIATLAGTGVAGVLYFTSKKNEANHLSGLKIGRKKTIKSWEVSARNLVGAQRLINQAMSQTQARRPDEAKQAIREVMSCVRTTVVGIFENIQEDDLTVTLGIPLDNGLELKIVELTPQRARRMPGGKYAFPAAPTDLHSMLEAFKIGVPIFTPNAKGVAGMEDKEYRSILSFPIVDRHWKPIAVINVDAVQAALFDDDSGTNADQASIMLIYELIQPSLQLIVGALEHCDPYPTGAGS